MDSNYTGQEVVELGKDVILGKAVALGKAVNLCKAVNIPPSITVMPTPHPSPTGGKKGPCLLEIFQEFSGVIRIAHVSGFFL